MIPEFPKFKKLELSDKKAVEVFTSKFPPYSDFNFFSMWGWDINNKMRISQLNGNLVVVFGDYVSGDNFLSFIGNKKVIETTTELLSYSKEKYKKSFLKLIPEETYLHYKNSNFVIKEDRGSFDYIYLVEYLANIKNWDHDTCARKVKKFLKNYPNHVVKRLSLKAVSKNEYKQMFGKWAKDKKIAGIFELKEYKAFERFLKLKQGSIKFISIYMGKELIGFSVCELLSSKYVIVHFSKGDAKNYPGIYDLLNWEEAKFAHENHIKYVNWEQDLGISGLRYAKVKYKPSFLLRKFIVSL